MRDCTGFTFKISKWIKMSMLDDLVYGTKQYHKEIQKVCEPLHRLFGTNHVGYLKIDNDGGLINLHTNAKWLDRCADQKYYLQDPTMVSPDNISSGNAFYFTYDNDEFTDGLLKDSINNFDMAHELVFINKDENGFEVIGITTPIANQKVYNKIVRYSKHMHNFIKHFSKKMQPIVNNLSDMKVDLSELKGSRFHEQESLISSLHEEQQSAETLMAQYS